MFGNLTGWHFLILLAVVLLLFGATKLPALAKSVGQSVKIFRGEMKTDADGNPVAATPVVETPAASVAAEPVKVKKSGAGKASAKPAKSQTK